RALEHATTATHVAHHVTHVIFRGNDLDLHDRLQQDRTCLGEAFLERHRAGDLERHFIGVHVMVRTIDGANLDVHDGETGKRAILHRFLNALVGGGDIFLRHHTTNDGAFEDIAGTTFLRLHLDDDVTILATATGLAHELAFLLERLADGLAVGHLRLADVGLDVEFATHAINDDIQVQLAHTRDDGLTRLFVRA